MNNYNMPIYQFSGQVMPSGQYMYPQGWLPEEQKAPAAVAVLPPQHVQSPHITTGQIKDFMQMIKEGKMGDIERFIGWLWV